MKKKNTKTRPEKAESKVNLGDVFRCFLASRVDSFAYY